MTRDTEFARIKRAVEQEKTKKVQGEAKLESLEQEEARILAEVKEMTGKDIVTAEDLQAYNDGIKSSIEEHIIEMKGILDEEGVSY